MAESWPGGPDAAGRALVLIHGAGGNGTIWGAVLAFLKGVPAVAVDLPGHGRSPGPPNLTVAGCASAVEAALSRAGVREYVGVGHSLGGAVALTLAARRAPGLAGVGAVSSGARLPVDPRIVKGAREAFGCTVEHLARFLFARGAPQDTVAKGAAFLAASGPEALHADFTACASYELGAAELARIAVPVDVVCGDADVLTPLGLSEELAAAVPGAVLTRLSGVGHTPLLEAPGLLAEVLAALWRRSFPPRNRQEGGAGGGRGV